MSNYILSCCSTADLTQEHFVSRDISYICLHFSLDGQNYPDDLGKSLPFEKFYKAIADGADARTSQVNITEYLDYFTTFLEQGKDILHVSLSTGISGTYNSACGAAAIAMERFPDRKVYVVDSLAASSGYGMFMDMLADKRDEGLNIEQLRDYAEELKLNVHHWFFSTDLSSYVKGGRISKTAGFVGGILGICPLLNMDANGRLIPRENIRTKKRVIKEIVKRMEQFAENGLDYNGKCYISHSYCYDDAREVADLIEANFKNLKGKVEIYYVGTVIGSHTGVGTVALYFMGNKRVNE